MARGEGRRGGCGAAVPAGHRWSRGKAAGSSIMSVSDKGAQLGRPGDQIRALLFLYSGKEEKKKNQKEERKKTHLMFFQPPALSPARGSGEGVTVGPRRVGG